MYVYKYVYNMIYVFNVESFYRPISDPKPKP